MDSDVGRTGSNAKGRRGFQELVSDVTLGKVGIILAYDATRLARNCSDWYQLLDLCGYRDCLIADHDGVYNPRLGQRSLDLGVERPDFGTGTSYPAHRLDRCNSPQSPARRVGSGLAYRAGPRSFRQVFKHPNLEVQSRLELVFDTFLKQKSASKVLRFFKDHDLTIPRKDPQGDIHWRAATEAAICCILKHPAYAGLMCTDVPAVLPGRALEKRACRNPFRANNGRYASGANPEYIPWETYERIQAMLSDNSAQYDRNRTRGVPRPGKALLHGIVYCGECGHKMVVQYKAATSIFATISGSSTRCPSANTSPPTRSMTMWSDCS